MQRLQRFFALTSLVTILLAALAFGMLHRAFMLEDLAGAAQLRAHATLGALDNALGNEAGHLSALAGASRKALLSSPVIHAVEDTTRTIVADMPMKRVSIVGTDGTVLYATEDRLIGRSATIPDGLEEAFAGRHWHEVRAGAGDGREAGLFQGITSYLTRMPLRDAEGRVVAALAVELDTTDMLAAANRRQIWFMALACAVLALTYFSLQMVVRRAGAIIQVEQDRSREETWRRQAVAAELEERERLLNTIADNLPVLLTYVGPDLRYRFNNARYEDWFGVAPRDTVGQRVPDLVGAENFGRVRRHIDRVLRGETVSFESPFQIRRGLIQARFDFVPHRDDSGGRSRGISRWSRMCPTSSAWKRSCARRRPAPRTWSNSAPTSCATASSASATSPNRHRTGSGKATRITASGYPSAPTLRCLRDPGRVHGIGLSRALRSLRARTPKRRTASSDLDAHRPFRDFTYSWRNPDTGENTSSSHRASPSSMQTGAFLLSRYGRRHRGAQRRPRIARGVPN